MKELKISAIKEGTVIDHIPARIVFEVLRILNPQEHKNTLVVATNLYSEKIGKKGIIKIAGKFLTQTEVNEIALLAPQATVNIIKDFNVKQKIEIQIPEKFVGIVRCPNPNCITNNEDVSTVFHVKSKKPVKLVCNHCERIITQEDIEFSK